MCASGSLGPKKPSLSVFNSLRDLLDALPSEPVAEGMMRENAPVISQDVMQVLWKLFFGLSDLGGGDDKRRALMVIGMCGATPILGLNFKNTDIPSVLSLFALAVQNLSESRKVDLMTPLADILIKLAADIQNNGTKLADVTKKEDEPH